jgi:hypothetical protein
MEKEPHHMNTQEKPPKVIGAFKHLLLELKKVNAINDITADHLLDRYIRGHIIGFGHLAELLLATGAIGLHNYDQVVYYGRKYGETR